MHPLTPERLFATAFARDSTRPFVTFYDESTGERTELSLRSLANWVAKTHYLLTDELGLGVGDRAVLAVPAHWISVPIVLGCLTAGLTFVDDGADVGADVGFTTADRSLDAADVFAVAADHAAVGLRDEVPAGMTDYVSAVRPQPDAWTSVHMPADDATPWWDGQTRGEAVVAARSRADEWGLRDGARLLTTRDWHDAADVLDTLVVPLVLAGSVVYVRNADDDVVARRAQQERAEVLGRAVPPG